MASSRLRSGWQECGSAVVQPCAYCALQALQHHKPVLVSGSQLTWDQHMLGGLKTSSQLCSRASLLPVVLWQSLEAFVAAKMAGGLQRQAPRCSDLVWAALGMGLTVLILGVLAGAANTLPVVGTAHQQVGEDTAGCLSALPAQLLPACLPINEAAACAAVVTLSTPQSAFQWPAEPFLNCCFFL